MKFKRPKISKKKIIIFSVFVFIAAIFWFLDALNREYTTKIEYPIELYNFPKELSVTSNYPEKLNVTVRAYGFDILGKINIVNPLKINVEDLSVKDKLDNSKLVISLKKISDDFFPKTTGIEIIQIHPEIIVLSTKKLLSKKVPVKLNINFTTETLYMQSGHIEIIPDSIKVSGSEKMLSNYDEAETVFKNYKNLNDTLTENIQLKTVNNLKFSKDKVKIILPVDKYTENDIKIPVKVINCPDSLKIVTFPNEISLTYKIGLSRYNEVGGNDFEVVVDYLQIKGKNKEKIQVLLTKQPNHLQSVKISPEYLEYIIEKAE
ncbi:MAG: hypothetical protein L3J35_07335 [Bacteroidales bacterium]|nr:hypothetical protein [Bacteroidales bacterium]